MTGPWASPRIAGHLTLPGDLTLGRAWRQSSFPEILKARGPGISVVKKHASSMGYLGAGMVNGGLIQVQVIRQLEIGPRALKRCTVGTFPYLA